MKKQQWSLTFLSSSVLLISGLLFYPLLSHEAQVPNDSTESYLPTMTDANIQCKKVVIDSDSTSNQIIKEGVQGGATPECDIGYVAVGINNGRLNSNNAITATFLKDSNPDSWGLTVSYIQSGVEYNSGVDSLNKISLVCVPRQIIFQNGPCTE